MRRLSDMSIQAKLKAIILATSGLALLSASVIVVAHDAVTSRQRHMDRARLLAEVIATQSCAAVDFDDATAAAEVLRALDRVKNIEGARLFRRDGTMLADYGSASSMPPRPEPGECRIADGKVLIWQSVRHEQEAVGTLYIRASLAELSERFWLSIAVVAGALAIGLLVAFPLATRLQRVVTGPVLELKKTMEVVASHPDRAVRAQKRCDDELGALADGFNSMLVQIEERDTALRRAHDDLERRVDERTIELQREVEERKQAVAELRAKEEQLVQAQKMEAVGRLAGGVAHDFNNMLQAILGFTSMGLTVLDPADPVHGYLLEVQKAGERAASLTRQLLAFSRRQVLQPKVLNLNVLMSDMQKMLRRLIGEDIELLLDLDTAIRPVKADPGQIEQLILNLAVNARDAMPKGGRIVIRTRHNDPAVPETLSVPHVTISVSDTGCGMDAATRAHLFEPFFTTKLKGQGTGLGLSTVYGIVKQSGGQIRLDSQVDRGTTFHITLPCVPNEEVRNETRGMRPLRGGAETILLVEDEDTVRGMLRGILMRAGYRVLEARNGRVALETVREFHGRIHLLLTDVVMPVMGGRELAERLQASQPDLKVVYMSGYTEDQVVLHGISMDRMPFLHKPFAPAALVAKVREVLDVPAEPAAVSGGP